MLCSVIDKNRKQYYIRGKKWVFNIHEKLPIPKLGWRRKSNLITIEGMGSYYDKQKHIFIRCG